MRTNILANAPDMSEHAKRSQLDASQRSSYGVTAQAAAQAIVRGVEVGAARVLVGAERVVPVADADTSVAALDDRMAF